MTFDSDFEDGDNQPQTRNSSQELDQLLNSLKRSRFDFNYASDVARKLGELAPDKLLISLLRDKRPMMRFAAVEACRVRDEDLSDPIIDHLLSRIDDRYDSIAAAAILALGEKKVESTIDELLDCVTMDNARVACASLEALYELDPQESKPHFDEFIDHGDFPRVAATARVIQKHKLTEHLGRLLSAAEQLAEELNPQLDRNNPWTIERRFMMEIVDVLAAFKHEAAIPLLKKLGTEYVGLRTHSLQALKLMEVDVSEIIQDAMDRKPSRGLRELQSGKTDQGPQLPGMFLLQPFLAANQEILSHSDADQLLNARVSGHAVEVQNHCAVIELSNGLHAILKSEDMHWTCLRNLRPYAERLTESREYQIASIDAESGYIAVSYKANFENPWLPESTFFANVNEGEVETAVRGGVLVKLNDYCIGFLPTGNRRFGEPEADFERGSTVQVRVKSADPDSCRVTLASPSAAE